MATTIKRKAASFRLPNYLLEGLKTEARRQAVFSSELRGLQLGA